MLTKAVEKLDGQRVQIRGYMLPSFQQSGIKQFVLMHNNMQCCFGPSTALYDCIIVEMVNDQSCEFSVRPIAVEGTFAVRDFGRGPTIPIWRFTISMASACNRISAISRLALA